MHSPQLSVSELDGWLETLVEAELIDRQRESRRHGDCEYRFRHALVRDAAYSLLTDDDRRVGHRLAGAFLVEAGESDPMVIAKHFRLGGEPKRAIPFIIDAAEQAFGGNDLQETLARVNAGIACGACGEDLGTLQGIACAAHFWSDDFTAAYPLGTSALSLLPRGSRAWVQTLGAMITVTSLGGWLEHFGELVAAFQDVQPDSDARGAYVEAASLLVTMFSFSGAHEPARRFLSLMLSAAGPIMNTDPLARGWLNQGHALYSTMLEADPPKLLRLTDAGRQASREASARRMEVLITAFHGMALDFSGEPKAAEAILRENLALAYRLGEPLSITHAKVWLGMTLAETGELGPLSEANMLAQDTVANSGANIFYLGCAYHIVARYRLAQGDLAGAEEAAVQGVTVLEHLPVLRAHVTSSHLRILCAAGRFDEALGLARTSEAILEQSECFGYAEVPLLTRITETYFLVGDRENAKRTLGKARAALMERADRFSTAEGKQRYLTQVRNHIRLAELTKELGEN